MIGSEQYITNILAVFERNRRVGLLVPPEPMGEGFGYDNYWDSNLGITKQLADKLKLQYRPNKENLPLTIGTAFWARTVAIAKLFEVEWEYEDFGLEPLAENATISHAVERILTYIALDAGYEIGIVMSDDYAGEYIKFLSRCRIQAFEVLSNRNGIDTLRDIEVVNKNVKRISDFFDKFENVYLYGAGKIGKQCCKLLEDSGRRIAGFLVTSNKEYRESYIGFPVLEVKQVLEKENIGVIITVSQKWCSDIVGELKKII